MPITLLYFLLIGFIVALLIVNVAWPIVNPRYSFFWMFRSDKYRKAREKVQDAITDLEIATLTEQASKLRNTGAKKK